MYRIYNSFKLNSNQRVLNALLYGIPTALGLGIAYGYISRILPITFSIVYVGIGYLIGMVIQKFGRVSKSSSQFLGLSWRVSPLSYPTSFVILDLA